MPRGSNAASSIFSLLRSGGEDDDVDDSDDSDDTVGVLSIAIELLFILLHTVVMKPAVVLVGHIERFELVILMYAVECNQHYVAIG